VSATGLGVGSRCGGGLIPVAQDASLLRFRREQACAATVLLERGPLAGVTGSASPRPADCSSPVCPIGQRTAGGAEQEGRQGPSIREARPSSHRRRARSRRRSGGNVGALRVPAWPPMRRPSANSPRQAKVLGARVCHGDASVGRRPRSVRFQRTTARSWPPGRIPHALPCATRGAGHSPGPRTLPTGRSHPRSFTKITRLSPVGPLRLVLGVANVDYQDAAERCLRRQAGARRLRCVGFRPRVASSLPRSQRAQHRPRAVDRARRPHEIDEVRSRARVRRVRLESSCVSRAAAGGPDHSGSFALPAPCAS